MLIIVNSFVVFIDISFAVFNFFKAVLICFAVNFNSLLKLFTVVASCPRLTNKF